MSAFDPIPYSLKEKIERMLGVQVHTERDSRNGAIQFRIQIPAQQWVAFQLMEEARSKNDLAQCIAERLLVELRGEVSSIAKHLERCLTPPHPGSEKSRAYGMGPCPPRPDALPPGMDMEHKAGFATGGLVCGPVEKVFNCGPEAHMPMPDPGGHLAPLDALDKIINVARTQAAQQQSKERLGLVPAPTTKKAELNYRDHADVLDAIMRLNPYWIHKDPTVSAPAPAPEKPPDTISREQFWRNGGFAGEPPERIK